MIDSPERNFSARVAYDGTGYAGFQLQPSEPTIQGELEKALGKVLGSEIRIHAASRTDAGVHAIGQVISFHSATPLPAGEIERAINALLAPDIRVGPVFERHDDFHARYSNKGKRYSYYLYRGERESPFMSRYSLWVKRDLNEDLMREAASSLIGVHDFRSFSPRLYEKENAEKEMSIVDLRAYDEILEIVLMASGFLYQMARCVVGALLEIGQGRMPATEIAGWIDNPQIGACRFVAPPRGLFLMEVFY